MKSDKDFNIKEIYAEVLEVGEMVLEPDLFTEFCECLDDFLHAPVARVRRGAGIEGSVRTVILIIGALVFLAAFCFGFWQGIHGIGCVK